MLILKQLYLTAVFALQLKSLCIKLKPKCCWCVCFSENGVEDEEDLYDCVYDDDEGGEVYEDLMKVELVQPQVS